MKRQRSKGKAKSVFYVKMAFTWNKEKCNLLNLLRVDKSSFDHFWKLKD